MDLAAEFSPAVGAAWAASPLASLRPSVVEELLTDAKEMSLEAGATFFRGRAEPQTDRLHLVVTGLLRVLLHSADGRQITLRYAAPGKLIGLPAVFRASGGVEGQALTASRVLVLSALRLRAAAHREPEVGWAVGAALVEILRETQDILSAHVFLPVRSRVARHLLDMASADGDRLVVRASHQDLADAIGSVREVISRTLRQFDSAGYVRRDGGLLVVVDPDGLHAVSLDMV